MLTVDSEFTCVTITFLLITASEAKRRHSIAENFWFAVSYFISLVAPQISSFQTLEQKPFANRPPFLLSPTPFLIVTADIIQRSALAAMKTCSAS
jgi:hypothetical protein